MRAFAPSETVAAVLRSADAVDWSRLRHLRGAATDIPNLLRALASNEDEACRHALRTLGSRILPFYDGIDGAVCEVTSHAIPYLARLAAADVRGAAEILVLLRRIASVAWDRDPYPPALPASSSTSPAARGGGATALASLSALSALSAIELRARFEQRRDATVANVARQLFVPTIPPRAPLGRWGRLSATVRDASAALFRHFDPVAAELLYGHRAHAALAASLPIFFELLSHPSEEVRTEAARLVERLAQSAARPDDLSIRIVARLESERDELVVAHLVLALGHTGDRHARTLLEALLDAQDPLVRVLAAVGLPVSPQDPSPRRRLEILVGALASAEGTLAERFELAASRSLYEDASRALRAVAADAPVVTSLLLAVLANARDRELPEPFLDLLLDVTFPDTPTPLAPTALTREQRLVLRRLSSATERLRGKDRDFTSRLAAKGLPTDPRGLERFFALN